MADPKQMPTAVYKRPAVKPTLDTFAKWLTVFPHDPLRAWNETFPRDNAENDVKRARASQIMLTRYVQKKLQEYRASEDKRLEAVTAAVDKELQLLAFSRMDDVATVGPGGVELRDNLAGDRTAAIQEVSQVETTDKDGRTTRNVKVKLVPKNEALRNIMERHGLKKQPEPPLIDFDVTYVNVGDSTKSADEIRREVKERISARKDQRPGNDPQAELLPADFGPPSDPDWRSKTRIKTDEDGGGVESPDGGETALDDDGENDA